MLFTPKTGSTSLPFALYLIYDPDATDCVGVSYIVKIEFDPADLGALSTNPGDHIDVYVAGKGTSGGFALAGDRVLVAQSSIGRDGEATLVEVPDLEIPIGGGNENVNWWVELQ